MELDKKEMTRVDCGAGKLHCNVQGVLNTLLVIFFILTSMGLWSCLIEINKLKQSTSSLSNTLYAIQTNALNNDVETLSVYSDVVKTFGNWDRSNGSDAERAVGNILNGSHTSVQKRAAVPIGSAYDPLSPGSHKDLTDYCVSLLSRKCSPSMPGSPSHGPPGPPGPPGNKGYQGRPGVMGHIGPPGLNGLKGQKGHIGSTGRFGEPGTNGPSGPPGFPGVNGIQGAVGRHGKRGLHGRAGKPGENGVPGIPGRKGQKGESGDPGGTINMRNGNCTCLGMKGEKGQRGLVGFTGYKGNKGDGGDKGDKGYGMQGFPGPKGPQGQKGVKGDNGHCRVSHCGDKYVRRKASEENFGSNSVKTEGSQKLPIEATESNTAATRLSTKPLTILQVLLVIVFSAH